MAFGEGAYSGLDLVLCDGDGFVWDCGAEGDSKEQAIMSKEQLEMSNE
jgi:hypothetical protein